MHCSIHGPIPAGSPDSLWEEGHARWAFNYDLMDLELGKKFWVSSCFTLRPYTGLRGTWMHTRLHVDTESSGFLENRSLIKNHYWGVGLLGGLQPSWFFCRCLSLFGNVSGALVWGKFWGESRVRGSIGQFNLFNKEKDAFYRMQGMLDLGIGLHWEESWCCNRFSTFVEAGWENHIWFNFGLHHPSSGPLISDLELGGLVVRLGGAFSMSSN